MKHAEATTLAVANTVVDGFVEVCVTDDGRGFDGVAHPGHLGLHTMRERAEAVGGTLELTGRVSAGTTVRCRVPAPRSSPAAPA